MQADVETLGVVFPGGGIGVAPIRFGPRRTPKLRFLTGELVTA